MPTPQPVRSAARQSRKSKSKGKAQKAKVKSRDIKKIRHNHKRSVPFDVLPYKAWIR
jgi:hypothetical protein